MAVIDMQRTGENIKYLMDENDISVNELSKRLGITVWPIYKWCKGLCLPTVDNLFSMSDIFNVRVDSIVILEEEKDGNKSIFR